MSPFLTKRSFPLSPFWTWGKRSLRWRILSGEIFSNLAASAVVTNSSSFVTLSSLSSSTTRLAILSQVLSSMPITLPS